MATAFTLLSWNVEHFRVADDDPKRPARVARVVEILEQEDPDVFALYEVEGKDLFAPLMDRMPGHHFHITEGGQTQEILVGVRNDVQSFMTQRDEFKAGGESLRPGSLLTVRVDGVNTTLLFLHTKSGTGPEDLELRRRMFTHTFNLKAAIDRVGGGKDTARFLFLGDLNVMGGKDKDGKKVSAAQEVAQLDAAAKKAGMRRLPKDRPWTWSNGPQKGNKKSDLDHVVVTKPVKARAWISAETQVRGWPAITDKADQQKWIDLYSDHGYLWVEVQK